MAAYSYVVEIRHNGLGKYRLVRGPNPYVVEQMANAQLQQWDEQYSKKQALARRSEERTNAALQRQEISQHREGMKVQAGALTTEAKQAIESISQILSSTLQVDDRVAWDSLIDRTQFAVAKPSRQLASPPRPINMPPAPNQAAPHYEIALNLWDRLSPSSKKAKKEKAKNQFESDLQAWHRLRDQLETDYRKAVAEAKEAQKNLDDSLRKAELDWERQKIDFDKARDERNAAVKEFEQSYRQGDAESIVSYCELVLSRSKYPDMFPQQFDVQYAENSGIIAIEYRLPAPADMPLTKDVKYVQSRDVLEAVPLSKTAFEEMYDQCIYQIALRTIHEVFEADVIGAVQAVCFNGNVRSVDIATGIEAEKCIVSVLANREEFCQINLGQVEPRACFKKLRGIGAARLHVLSAVAPVMRLERDDRRFVAGYGVSQNLEEGTNLAAMPWEDFEHLIREVFEREFSNVGGEVKVTRASRDGGVDVVVFDPDPLRGGKIIIQAKRYTATVSVSAVRDLYGTILNEGASKGILVTTSDFGADSYEFAKGKPIVLMSGGNLLHIMAKHGQNVRIDLAEARRT